MQVDTGKTIANDVMQIGDVNVDIKDIAKGPIVVGNQVNSSIPNLLWVMIMRLVAVVQWRSTFNQGGVLRG
jgi:hypothetical protein